jgi:hypothetical protein
MSKQAEAKIAQGYTRVTPCCGNCRYFESDSVRNSYGYDEEKMLRCGIGEFKVHKMGWCQMFESGP